MTSKVSGLSNWKNGIYHELRWRKLCMDKVFSWGGGQIGDPILCTFRKVDRKGRQSYTFLTRACLQTPPAHLSRWPSVPFRLLCFGLLFKTCTEQIQTWGTMLDRGDPESPVWPWGPNEGANGTLLWGTENYRAPKFKIIVSNDGAEFRENKGSGIVFEFPPNSSWK